MFTKIISNGKMTIAPKIICSEINVCFKYLNKGIFAMKLFTICIKTGSPKCRNKVNLQVCLLQNIQNELSFRDGLSPKGHKIIIPDNLYKEMLNLLHVCHLGIVKCMQKDRGHFYRQDLFQPFITG